MNGEQNRNDSGWVCLEEKAADTPKLKKRRTSAPKKQKKPRRSRRKTRKTRKKRHILRGTAITLAGLAVLYCVLVFSHIPFIEKWRTIYIETAMGTMNHQWLATLFLPQSVIDDVMSGRMTIELRQEEYNSSWDTGTDDTSFADAGEDAVDTWDDIREQFSDAYAEIDQKSFWAYMAAHKKSEVLDEDGYLMIDQADYDDEETGIRTIYGDPVCAIDTRNGIVIVGLKGDGYSGRMAIVKNPAQVRLAVSNTLGSSGSYLNQICRSNNAVLGINASGFSDPEGTGNGGDVFGMVVSGGRTVIDTLDTKMKVIGMDSGNRLNISETLPAGTRDAMQFSPALIVNGRQLISGSSGWGLQPRSVIGQTRDGQMLLAVIDGRQPGYSIGITLGDLTDILYEYGAYQACNLDGGSSSVMYYRGRNITRSSAVTPDKGRHIPNAWIVDAN
ncbi:phosphodiester glycosidase family protein [Butyricicoccus sp.]|uniref:phosphodiester glycosidase family protein n=1 Tax=Butyricicoccus sp. TaxID=2049021 RepID=UPI003F1742AA